MKCRVLIGLVLLATHAASAQDLIAPNPAKP
jgi:hypothetical protein